MTSLPTCQVCHKQFSLKGPAPFLLPCFHVVCETCMGSADGQKISCSPCQRDVNLTETPLQKDVVREQEILHLTIKHQPELVLCTLEDDGNQAVCWCKECDDFLCENCQMVHGNFKATKKHAVLDIGELLSAGLEAEEYCTIHQRYLLEIWDETCGSLICAKCKLGDHADHKTVDFDEAAETAKKEVEALAKEVQSTVDQHGACLTEAEQDLQSSDETCDTLTENISLTFNTLRALMDQREKELMITLQQHQEKVRREMGQKRDTSEVHQQRCQATSDYINKTLQYSSRRDIMSLSHLLQSKTGDGISSARAVVHDRLPLTRFNTDGLEKIKSVLAGFGAISLENDPTLGQAVKDCGTQTDDWVTTECEKLKESIPASFGGQGFTGEVEGRPSLRLDTRAAEPGASYLNNVEDISPAYTPEISSDEQEGFGGFTDEGEESYVEEEETDDEEETGFGLVEEEQTGTPVSSLNVAGVVDKKPGVGKNLFGETPKSPASVGAPSGGGTTFTLLAGFTLMSGTPSGGFGEKSGLAGKPLFGSLSAQPKPADFQNYSAEAAGESFTLPAAGTKGFSLGNKPADESQPAPSFFGFGAKATPSDSGTGLKVGADAGIFSKPADSSKPATFGGFGGGSFGGQTSSASSSEAAAVTAALNSSLLQEMKQLKTSHEKEIQSLRENMIKLEDDTNVLYQLKSNVSDEKYALKCPHVEFSKTKYSANLVHINAEGELVNRPQTNPPHSDQRLKVYQGTSSSVPLQQCGSPQYMEVKTRVRIDKTLSWGDMLLEIGLAREEEQDQLFWIARRPHSYSLTVSHCSKHSSICRKVWRHGEKFLCLSDTLKNTPGTSSTLHYGVVYDSARSRIAFLDVQNEKIIAIIDDVDNSVALWPMFGGFSSGIATVSMSLVVGADISMTERKKALVLECLS